MPDGRIGHSELEVGGARWMMADEHPELHVEAPDPARGAAVTLHLDDRPGGPVVDRVVAPAAPYSTVDPRTPVSAGSRSSATRSGTGGSSTTATTREEGGDMPLRTKTWCGVVLDAPDGPELADFYQRLLGWKLFHESPGWVDLAPSEDAGYNLALPPSRSTCDRSGRASPASRR